MYRITIFFPFIISIVMSLEIPETNGEHIECKRSKIDPNVTLAAGHHAGSFLKANSSIATMKECVEQCCIMNGCDVAFFSNGACYSVLCKNVQSCAPTSNLDKRMKVSISFVAKPNKKADLDQRTNKNGEPAITDNFVSEVTKESPFLFDDPSESLEDENVDLQLLRARRESWRETKDMIIAISCGFIAVAVGVVGVILMTRKLVEDDDDIDWDTIIKRNAQKSELSNDSTTKNKTNEIENGTENDS